MIVCEHCDSARFLNITRSRTYVPDGERVTKITESIECLNCGLEGTAEYDLADDTATITGGLTHTTDRPTTATDIELRGGTQ